MALNKFRKMEKVDSESENEIEILPPVVLPSSLSHSPSQVVQVNGAEFLSNEHLSKNEVLTESDCNISKQSDEIFTTYKIPDLEQKDLQCTCNETSYTINADGSRSLAKLHGVKCERRMLMKIWGGNDYKDEEIFITCRIPDLEQKVEDIILSNKRHPAKRLHAEYLWEKLEELVTKGIVKRHDSEDKEYHIYNYTNKPFKYPNLWNYFTLISRGLVLRVDHEWYEETPKGQRVLYPSYVEVAALTWPKFFNINEDLNPNDITENADKLEITNKVDGSLGIIFFNTYEQKWQCCTKGSFVSEQANFANDFLTNMETERLTPGHTYLVEIVCDKNDLIIKYDFQGLILLGAYTSRGEEYTYDELKECCTCVNTDDKKMFDLVHALDFTTLSEVEKYVNKTRDRENLIEGVVVKYYINETCHRFKWKTQAYLHLHKTREKLSKKTIFQALSKSDEDIEELRDKISEEFYTSLDKTVEEYRKKIAWALEKTETILEAYWDDIKIRHLEDSKTTLLEWMKKNYPISLSKTQRRDRSLILKAYRDGMDTFKKSWIQRNKPEKQNRDRKFLFDYVSI